MSLHFAAKQSFINKHYGNDIELLSVSTQEGKVDVIKILQQTFNCKSEEILFVDDLQEVVDLMKEQGYMALLESEVKSITINEKTLLEILDD